MFDFVRPGGLRYSVLAAYIDKVRKFQWCKLIEAKFNKFIPLISTKSIVVFMCSFYNTRYNTAVWTKDVHTEVDGSLLRKKCPRSWRGSGVAPCQSPSIKHLMLLLPHKEIYFVSDFSDFLVKDQSLKCHSSSESLTLHIPLFSMRSELTPNTGPQTHTSDNLQFVPLTTLLILSVAVLPKC